MNIIPVNSSQNPSVKQLRALHQRAAREKQNLFLIEGPKLLNEAFAKGIEVRDVVASMAFYEEGLQHVDQSNLDSLHVADDRLFKEVITTQTSCGIVGIGVVPARTLEDCLRGAESLIVIGEAIQDPGNAGTLMRAALALGATGIVMTKGSVDAYSPKVVRSAMGALFLLPVVMGIELETVVLRLRAAGVRIVGLDMVADESLETANLRGPLAIMLGNESNGLTKEARHHCDELVKISMSADTESLNVAICGSIALYQCSVQRCKTLS